MSQPSMASPLRFRPALLSIASVGLLVGYLLLERAAHGNVRGYHASEGLALGLVVAALAAPLVFVARIAARWRLQGTGKDAFAKLRTWATSRPRAVLALLAAPTVLALAGSFSHAFIEMFTRRSQPYSWHVQPSGLDECLWLLALWIAPAVGAGLVGRALLRGLFTPLVDEEGGGEAEGFSFSAVAVTPEARAAVGGIFAVSVGMVAALAWLPQQIVYAAPGFAGLLGYFAIVVGGALAFQRVSRIGLGFDGVLVTGSSRTRFYGYRDIDEVETTRGGDVLLRQQGRVVLRLQLHGRDEGRHAAIVERIRAGLACARAPGGGGADRLAEDRRASSFAHAASGQGNYRAPGLTRAELWELVLAPAASGASRAAAAGALAIGADRADRARLRIAAERCAEPAARAALAQSAAEDEAAEDEADGDLAGGVLRAKNA